MFFPTLTHTYTHTRARSLANRQNGFAARDGCVYGIPVQAQCVLCIDTRNDNVSTLSGAPMTRDAYEGGVIVNEELYCIPMRARYMMKVVPGGTLV
jgi:hypothetical protein